MRRFLELDDIRPLLAEAGFAERPVTGLSRLTGGSVKGVYRVSFGDGGTALVYRWHADEDFWPSRAELDQGPFAGPRGRQAFLDRHSLLTGLSVRVPHVYGVNGLDLALVEDVRNGTLEALLDRDAAAGREVLARLRGMLRAMHAHTSTGFGWPGLSCEGIAVDRGRRALVEAAARVPRIAAVQERLAYELSARHAAVQQRSAHGVIHGELGPDHVMVDDSGMPVLIDIEGAMVFDVEWEHAFLELRFGPLYPELHTVPLDEARMSLYRLVMYLSLVAGPLMLVEGDFPRADGMRQIAEWNTERVLSALPVG